jgi:hypothetical protein
VPLDFSSVGRTDSHRAPGHCVSRRDYSSSGLHQLYCAYAVHPDASSRCSTSLRSVALTLAVCPVIPLCVVTTRLAAATDILRLRRASGCLGTSRGSSRGSLSTTSTMPRVRVPRHVMRLVAPLIADYFANAVRPGASAHRAARHAARRRLLRLCRASGCLDKSCGSSRRSSSTSTMPRVRVPRHVARVVMRLVAPLVVDYFDYAACPGASARRATRRAAHHTAHRAAHHAARRQLLCLRRASGCLGTSRGSSRGSSRRSSSTTLPTPCVRVPRHVARVVMRLVAPLVVDYFAYATRPGASTRHTAHHVARC